LSSYKIFRLSGTHHSEDTEPCLTVDRNLLHSLYVILNEA